MRVAVDGRVLQDRYHGIGRYTYELLQEFARRDVETVVFRDPRAPSRLDVAALADCESLSLVDFPAPVVGVAAQVRWPALLARVDADVLLVPYHLAVPLVPSSRLPVLSLVHDCTFERDPSAAPGGSRFSFAYRTMTRMCISRSSAVATISESTRRDLQRFYGLTLTDDAVLPTGVGRQFYRRSAGGSPAGVPPGRFLLHVGVHRPHKNHAVLLAAFALLAAEDPTLTLVLVGQADERFPDAVTRLVQEHGVADRVLLLRDVDEEQLLRLYGAAAAFAFPSLHEGFGLPVLEAMAAGLPVVASDAPAVQEAAAGAALVTPARDVEAWATSLRRVLHDDGLAGELARRGRVVAAQHTWDRTCESALALLGQLARGGRLAPRRGAGC